jgi:hypothetical protein
VNRLSLRRLTLACAAILLVLLVAVASATPDRPGAYDGLIFRAVGELHPSSGTQFILGCASVTSSTVSEVASVLRAAPSGETVSRTTVHLTFSDGKLVALRAFGQTAKPASGLTITAAIDGTCTGLKTVGTSPAGDLYDVSWFDTVCDNATCSNSHTSAGGKGCAAIARTPTAAAATIQIGACTPAAFPALPARWSEPVPLAILKKGLLDGLLVRFSGDKSDITTRRGQPACGNTPSRLYSARADRLDVLRPATRASITAPPKINSFAFVAGVNAKNQAFVWGGAVSLLVNGGAAELFLEQDDPRAKLDCKTRPEPRQLSKPLPVGIWVSPALKVVFVGSAWLKATIRSDNTWTALVAFGAPDFSP